MKFECSTCETKVYLELADVSANAVFAKTTGQIVIQFNKSLMHKETPCNGDVGLGIVG